MFTRHTHSDPATEGDTIDGVSYLIEIDGDATWPGSLGLLFDLRTEEVNLFVPGLFGHTAHTFTKRDWGNIMGMFKRAEIEMAAGDYETRVAR